MRTSLYLVLLGLWVTSPAGLADSPQVMTVTFEGMGTATTRPVILQRTWHVSYRSSSSIQIQAISTDGTVTTALTNANGAATGPQTGVSDSVTKVGGFTLQVQTEGAWEIKIVENGFAEGGNASAGNAAGGGSPATASSPTRALVLIKGDKAEGTGFLVRTATGPAVVTNLHVISANPHIRVTTTTGVDIPLLSLKGASDRDLAMFTIKDNGYSYLDLAADVSSTVQSGDAVTTPGNSQGGEVMLNTNGAIQGIGPQRVEFNNPIYHGNSGGPVLHTKSGKVVAVVTEAMKVDVTNDLDKTSFQSRNSAIAGGMRYFGLRLDTVPQWEPYDWNRFLKETQFLNDFHQESLCLDSFLNETDRENNANGTSGAKLYLSNDSIRTANENFYQAAGGGGTSQRMDALRTLLFSLGAVADNNLASIQNLNNFYTFDQERAKDEIAYRKALKSELDAIGNNVSRLGSLARKSN